MFGFVIALVAGFLAPHAEAPLARPLAETLRGAIKLEDGEMKLFSFMVVMVIAGALCAMFDAGSPLGVILGGVIGYFGLRLSAFAKSRIDGKRP
ncbi:hypothetical protein JQU17_04040 [Ponticoccus sp. SC2-23]|jgi:hypothetical protein|uniref:hypothetical protein n=1 Tax=Alexandriicola marinus TaxID=2081710 RepID=UPI000FDBD88C|nr:hypothetical protein [Alexandriicola marinus]MBM1219356.1 hypothetical protein [Ponticoccus sp. SC6-9]MBM1223572.1 hypothetical protein [Ponticoccus sp. SC6-15]MBM1229169.1 hypothetical protein [Ponticoccus sp. SC6-38]MBM1232538.1 hypothetical protein [Ponticoccus sp. SC6-45]MBM1237512.1 hypothetical protein [Ponticoccus sp. SC6-49]MBM1241549.1 hypothetical protein [Ponticoccus sp. SC2-64]MBM1246062.1 hypothetical protein [Ponticoccus sp. SC6-42]MBM1250540.1 hypothetical protein [Pontico